MKRSDRKNPKRKGLRNFILGLTTILLLGIIYWIYQFNSGQSLAGKGLNKEGDTEFEPFEAEDPQFGEINVLLLGSDARKDDGDARSDSLMIAHYNQTTNEVKLVSVMRDIYVEIPEYGKHKINTAFALGGPELVRKTIKENFDIDVHYYAMVDFTGFPKIIDVVAPDGIEVDIKSTMSHGIGMTLNPGEQVLHGEQLLGYVRYRNDIRSDYGRVERQQEVLSKVKDQAVSVHSLLNLPKILGVVEPYVDTNVDSRTILTIGKGMLTGKAQGMETMRIPVENSFDEERLDRVGEVLTIDFEKNKQALQEFLSAEAEVSDSKAESDEVSPE